MSIFIQLFKSLYAPKEMALFRFQKIGKTILYIMLLCLLATVPKTILLGDFIHEGINLIDRSIEKDVPDFKIENGELHANISKPIIKDETDFIFVFDPNATDTKAYPNRDGIFILKNKMVSTAQQQTQSFPYSDLGNTTFEKKDAKEIVSFIDSISSVAIFLIGIFIYLFELFITFLGVSLLAFIGSAMSGVRKLSYKQVWTLTAYSFTIPTIFFMIMDLLKINVPFSLFIFIGVVLVVLYLTIKEVPRPKEKNSL
ncbi:Maltodextrin utilization protein YvdJ [Bacillus sp. 491mf]|uniref:DUF1189 domain-containing protein n=1 Tax=Bacillus sp. 491mf TaxID=1761755 RepID=UPI0008E96BD8|nr:DUF1189 domain-containing protein [Bacillus sp. 491mf]SFC51066.1 Maltodextrin utilization protein YvdJ [Bacillus sp. 491mf]